MKRLGKCLKFGLGYTSRSTLVFLGFYFGIYAVIAAMILLSKQRGGGSSINTSFFIAGAIYIFAFITSSYKSLFNNLIMFGNTRKSITVSSYITNAVLSVAIAIISVISVQLDGAFAAASGNRSFDMLDLMYAYPGGVNIAIEFLWFLAFFIFLSAFSMLYGSMAYKFGRIFKAAFWIGIFILFMLIPMLTGLGDVIAVFKAFFSLGGENGILLAPVNFIAAASILGACAYLIVRRQPQEA